MNLLNIFIIFIVFAITYLHIFILNLILTIIYTFDCNYYYIVQSMRSSNFVN